VSREILIGGVDAMLPAIRAAMNGSMHATVRNVIEPH
jgi:hypothetical protein